MGKSGTFLAAFFCWQLFVLFLLKEAVGQSKQTKGRVCARNTLRIPLVYNETYAKPQHQPYLKTCPGPRICSTYRTTYRIATRQVKKEILQSNVICCQGWKKRHLGDTKCEEDVDECRASIDFCQQHCVNTEGSYYCQCNPGYALEPDGKSCRVLPTAQAAPLLSIKGQVLGIQETIPNEIQELQAKVEQLEERLERAISVLPSTLEPAQMKEMWSRLRYLDQVESLSDQLLFLEEKLGDCEYQQDLRYVSFPTCNHDNILESELEKIPQGPYSPTTFCQAGIQLLRTPDKWPPNLCFKNLNRRRLHRIERQLLPLPALTFKNLVLMFKLNLFFAVLIFCSMC
ncbi:epidermal growth factor-like protein 8 isoform X2 [Anolis carolinensis]|uniref:epidermal growth factor-like protein 8 isoform X2 n=1 Tax=Anolis carolinensis TaxID=28377 RepID=UPI002F2B5543